MLYNIKYIFYIWKEKLLNKYIGTYYIQSVGNRSYDKWKILYIHNKIY